MITTKVRLTTDALVVREMDVGENDKLLTLLTRNYGVIKAFSSGSKKLNNKKFSASSLLSYANFSLVKTGDTYKVFEASTIESFFSAGTDITVLALSQYFCELAFTLAPEESDAEEYLRLLLNSLHFLIKEKKNRSIIKSVLELRIAVLSGFMPDLVACRECSCFESDLMYFDIKSGEIICNDCINNKNSDLIPIDRTMLSAMRHIVYSQFEKLFSFEIPFDHAELLSVLCEKFLTYHSEHRFITLEFYNQIK